MRDESFATFMEMRGRHISEAAGVLWYSTKAGIYMSIPLQETLNPLQVEVEQMLRKVRGLGVRFPSLGWAGLPSGAYVLRKKSYNLKSLVPKQRSCVQRGLESCQVRVVGDDQLFIEGLQCNLDTMERQGRFDSEFGDMRRWKRLVNAIRQCPNVGAIGAFVGDRLAAYLVTYREGRWFHILHQMSRRDALGSFPNHALTFQVTKDSAEDSEIDGVCYGLAGLTSGGGLHRYKLSFGYELVPHNSVFLLHPSLAVLTGSSLVLRLIRAQRRLQPGAQILGQIESVLEGARVSRLKSASA